MLISMLTCTNVFAMSDDPLDRLLSGVTQSIVTSSSMISTYANNGYIETPEGIEGTRGASFDYTVKGTTRRQVTYWTVPKTGKYTFELRGSKGGVGKTECFRYVEGATEGGYGGYCYGTVYLTQGTVFTLLTGCIGEDEVAYKLADHYDEDGRWDTFAYGETGDGAYVIQGRWTDTDFLTAAIYNHRMENLPEYDPSDESTVDRWEYYWEHQAEWNQIKNSIYFVAEGGRGSYAYCSRGGGDNQSNGGGGNYSISSGKGITNSGGSNGASVDKRVWWDFGAPWQAPGGTVGLNEKVGAYSEGATWKGNAYINIYRMYFSLTYDKNPPAGHSKSEVQVNIGNVEFEENEKVTITNERFTLKGYNFKGWNDRADGKGTWYEKGTQHTFNKDITLYAQWEPIEYEVIVYPNVPEGTSNNIQLK